MNILQSAYKPGHSTETALVKVQNDILTSIDQHGVVILVMLDLSAAFDTIDHDILFSRMENTLGITGQALAWFKSYLSGRTLRIKIDKSFSELQDILWSVPQGSVLGPLLFLIYPPTPWKTHQKAWFRASHICRRPHSSIWQ